MGCSHSAPSPGDGPPQGPRPVRREAPDTQSSIHNRTTSSAQQQSHAATADGGSWHQQSTASDPRPPPPETNAITTIRRKPVSSAPATSSSRVVTPGDVRAPLTDGRQQLLQSIRERPAVANQGQLRPQESGTAMDVRVAFSKAMQRGDTSSPRYNSLYAFQGSLLHFCCSYSYHGLKASRTNHYQLRLQSGYFACFPGAKTA